MFNMDIGIIFSALTFILLTIKACTNEIIYKSIIVEEQ